MLEIECVGRSSPVHITLVGHGAQEVPPCSHAPSLSSGGPAPGGVALESVAGQQEKRGGDAGGAWPTWSQRAQGLKRVGAVAWPGAAHGLGSLGL